MQAPHTYITSLCAYVDPHYLACEPQTCGNQSIRYPFYIQGKQQPFCGYPGFAISCAGDIHGFPTLNLSNTPYIIHQIFYHNESLRVSNAAFSSNTSCISPTHNLTLPPTRTFTFLNQNHNKDILLFFGCNLSSMPTELMDYRIGCSGASNKTGGSVLALYKDDVNTVTSVSKSCGSGGEVVDAVVEGSEGGMEEELRRGFMLNWTASDCKLCNSTGGRCGFNSTILTFQCYCTDRIHASKCDITATGERRECPASFNCGYVGNISFPLTTAERQECGLLAINNCYKPAQEDRWVQLSDEGKTFIVIRVSQQNFTSIQFRDKHLYDLLQSRNCNAFRYNYTLSTPPTFHHFASLYMEYNTTLHTCNPTLRVPPTKNMFRYANCTDIHIYYGLFNHTPQIQKSLASCTKVVLPIKDVPDGNDPFTFVNADIIAKVILSQECTDCHYKQRGQCQLDSKSKFCCANVRPPENTSETTCLRGKKDLSKKAKLGLVGLGIGFLGILIIGLLLLFRIYKRKRVNSGSSHFESRYSYSDSSSNPHLDNGAAYLGVPLFSYKDLKEATNNFDHNKELGDGGFGTVYYGKLQDGREVAVKRLYEHNYRRVEQFINEVQILTRLRHKNLVSLYGCTSRHSRELLLVYEYISNGTVACHLHGESAKRSLLPWSTRIKIAIETATALAYLHASDIIHRDVKTNNILLDHNFTVKVADFGLSRLFPMDATHVSTAPQGTPGYVDPEYHQNYQLTSKSDVYSFGVVLIELISSMPAVDMNRDKDEINLSNLAMKKIQNSAIIDLVDRSLGFDSDNKVRRMIVSVAELAFQCLQRDKELRPSMDEVLDELKKIESGKDHAELQEEADVDGNEVSHNKIVHSLPPPSPEWDEVGLLKHMKIPPSSSPITVTDNWESKCTTPSISA
nr:LEAF RUST 10 DISEASE-RESISTANCE LOCUS RECEPTOR-LIKE PROTEIN KINASE-like 1.2 isoform X5 [Arachis hypogaea]